MGSVLDLGKLFDSFIQMKNPDAVFSVTLVSTEKIIYPPFLKTNIWIGSTTGPYRVFSCSDPEYVISQYKIQDARVRQQWRLFLSKFRFFNQFPKALTMKAWVLATNVEILNFNSLLTFVDDWILEEHLMPDGQYFSTELSSEYLRSLEPSFVKER